MSWYKSDNIEKNNNIPFSLIRFFNQILNSGLNGRFNGITKGEFRQAAEDRIGHLGQNPAGN